MKKFDFTIRISGSAKGTVKATDKKAARELIKGGQWDDIDIDVEDVIEVEYLKESKTNSNNIDIVEQRLASQGYLVNFVKQLQDQLAAYKKHGEPCDWHLLSHQAAEIERLQKDNKELMTALAESLRQEKAAVKAFEDLYKETLREAMNLYSLSIKLSSDELQAEAKGMLSTLVATARCLHVDEEIYSEIKALRFKRKSQV